MGLNLKPLMLLLLWVSPLAASDPVETKFVLSFREAIAARDFEQFRSLFSYTDTSPADVRAVFDELVDRRISDVALLDTNMEPVAQFYTFEGNEYRLPAVPNKDLRVKFPSDEPPEAKYDVASYRVWRARCDENGCNVLLGSPVQPPSN